MKRTGPSNAHTRQLISELRKASLEQNVAIWKRIADDLERPTRQRRAVNLARINRFTKENEVVIVPGKVLASGSLDHKITVSAFACSGEAKEKIKQAKGELLTIAELLKKNPKGQKVRIIG